MKVYKCNGYRLSDVHPLIEAILGNGHWILKHTVDHHGSIVIKANIAPASQVSYRYYTNPMIVNVIYDYLTNLGFSNVSVVESETSSVFAYHCLTPDVMAKSLGYKMKVIDLSRTELVPMYWGSSTIHLSKVMTDARFIINVPKAKNHDLMLMTGALKNMYGSIPHPNKYLLFHHKRSGIDVPEATVFVNVKTPPHLHIVDFVESIDGDEYSYSRKKINNFKYYYPHRILSGSDPIEIDKYLSLKMGYTADESPIVKRAIKRMGDRKIRVIGDDLDPFKGWRRVSWSLNTKAKIQDKIPVTEKMIAMGTRSYKFDVCPIKKDDK